MSNKPNKPNYYTQRDWDRAVGYGTVPEKYQYPKDWDWAKDWAKSEEKPKRKDINDKKT